VPALVKALGDKDRSVMLAAARALAELGHGEKSVAALVGMLKAGGPADPQTAAEALGDLGDAARAAVPALKEALKDKDQFLREAAAAALGDIGLGAKAAVPALETALKDTEEVVREAAAESLKKIQAVGSP